MNFENYNKIYQEILDDENNELSANYLLNKYQIKHEEELINILNQIKKNEYISSDNKAINRLLKELDEDENLLDINEIIDIKERIITEDFQEEESIQDNATKEEETENHKNPQEKTKKNSENKKNNINNYLNIKYTAIILIILVIFIIILFIFDLNKTEEKEIQKTAVNNIETIKESKSIENEQKMDEQSMKTEDNAESNTVSIKEEIPKNDEIIDTKEKHSNDINQTTKENSVEEKLDTIITYDKTQKEEELSQKKDIEKSVLNEEIKSDENNNNEFITLSSLEDIERYKEQLLYQEGKLIFNNQSYKENDTLFGFKIYKLTPLYVKFEDENKHMRKRILLKK